MSKLQYNDNEIAKIAERLSDEFRRIDSRPEIKIAALATFIPELVSADTERPQIGIGALTFLIKLCRHLQTYGHPAKTIQIVSGCVCSGIWPAVNQVVGGIANGVPDSNVDLLGADEETLSFGASLLTETEGFDLLCEGLAVLIELVKEIEEHDKKPQWLNFAIEMEPGPLHVLGQEKFGSVRRIQRFCEHLKRFPTLSPYVGLNLDVANWGFLGGIQTSQIWGTEVYQRICHANISERSVGNFSDAVPGACHEDSLYTPWIDLIHQRISDNTVTADAFPKCNECISLELEATKTRNHVWKGYENTVNLLG
jgi:hypothetical protein